MCSIKLSFKHCLHKKQSSLKKPHNQTKQQFAPKLTGKEVWLSVWKTEIKPNQNIERLFVHKEQHILANNVCALALAEGHSTCHIQQ